MTSKPRSKLTLVAEDRLRELLTIENLWNKEREHQMKVNKIVIHAPLTLSALIAHFQNAIGDSEYKEYIKIEPMGKLAFKVVIKKAGTSELFFTEVADKRIDGECSVMLYKSEIAFLHKGSIPAVFDWIKQEVEKIGGTVIEN